MKRGFHAICFTLLATSAAFWGCRADESRATTTPAGQSDTRARVQEAYQRIDVMNLPFTFNAERLAILKQRVEQETDPGRKINGSIEVAMEMLKCGQIDESIALFNSIWAFLRDNKVALQPEVRRNLYALIGIAYMRKGEIDNCVQRHNHESCFIPIQGDGIHALQEGSRKAIEIYTLCLREFPDDLETRYLLNIAYQTLGEYPHGVPKEYLVPPSWFTSRIPFPRFKDVAPQLGLNTLSLAGGVIVDDFTNDGWLDIVQTSWSPREELIFYVNNGDGTFTDKTAAYGLEGHVGILNCNQADINNDGWLDILLMRGGWYQQEGDVPSTLLQNTGKGGFVDVTEAAGLLHVAACQNAAWADYNLDGWIDVVMGNESKTGYDRGINLYINNGDGTFTDQAKAWGLTGHHYIKGSTAADIDNDRFPDIYFSTLDTLNLLFVNGGKSKRDRFIPRFSRESGGLPIQSFPCWSFDFDNDGDEDLFSSAFSNEGTPATHWMKSHLGTADPEMLPKLYRNDGNLVFEEVGAKMGLNEVTFTMGCNFGDINVDGYLDFYLATGNPLFQSLVPNKMYLNMGGRSFEDVSYAGGFANVQKGHGVGFGDLDHDGDEDLYAQIGGSFDGDGFYNCLFENPNHEGNNWVVLNLTGTKANRPAIGARVLVTVDEGGIERRIYRTVTSGASFGANSLALEIGLGKASAITSVTVQWPCMDCPDETFKGLAINKAYRLTQGSGKPESVPYTYVPFSSGHSGHGHH